MKPHGSTKVLNWQLKIHQSLGDYYASFGAYAESLRWNDGLRSMVPEDK
jgi:hypothetical protein